MSGHKRRTFQKVQEDRMARQLEMQKRQDEHRQQWKAIFGTIEHQQRQAKKFGCFVLWFMACLSLICGTIIGWFVYTMLKAFNIL